MNKGMKFMVSSSMSLNPMGILQEKFLKRMSSLWKMREEMQLILNQEAKKRMKLDRYMQFIFTQEKTERKSKNFTH